MFDHPLLPKRSQNPEERKVSDKDQQRFEGLPVEEAHTDHRLEEAQTDHRLEAEESVFGGRRVHRGFNSLPLLHRSADVSDTLRHQLSGVFKLSSLNNI